MYTEGFVIHNITVTVCLVTLVYWLTGGRRGESQLMTDDLSLQLIKEQVADTPVFIVRTHLYSALPW